MHSRTLISLTFALLALAIAAACGGGDDSSTDTPTSPATSGSPTPEITPSPSPTGQPQVTLPLLVTPSRSLPAADHTALAVIDVITFLEQNVGTDASPTPVECTGLDLATGIIDCTAQGYGTIALDPIPHGGDNWKCNALLTPDGTFFGAGCNGGTTGFIYDIQS